MNDWNSLYKRIKARYCLNLLFFGIGSELLSHEHTHTVLDDGIAIKLSYPVP